MLSQSHDDVANTDFSYSTRLLVRFAHYSCVTLHVSQHETVSRVREARSLRKIAVAINSKDRSSHKTTAQCTSLIRWHFVGLCVQSSTLRFIYLSDRISTQRPTKCCLNKRRVSVTQTPLERRSMSPAIVHGKSADKLLQRRTMDMPATDTRTMTTAATNRRSKKKRKSALKNRFVTRKVWRMVVCHSSFFRATATAHTHTHENIISMKICLRC